jgi:hypothetical protein
VVALLLLACEANAAPGSSCARSSDCPEGLVCAIGRCRIGCRNSNDCALGARCLVDPSVGASVCSLPAVDDCATHQCPIHFTCRNGVCLNVCGDVPHCPDGTCDVNACVPVHGDGGVGSDAGPTTISSTITDDQDDGEIGPPVLYDGESLNRNYTGFWSSTQTRAFLRFTLPSAIPSGAHVIDARMHLSAVGVAGMSDTTEVLVVAADRLPDAPPIATATDYPGGTAATPITTSVTWPAFAAWPALGAVTSPDLSPIIQELVDSSGGLAAGAHVALWMWGTGYTHDAEVGFQDTSGPITPTSLTITWQR